MCILERPLSNVLLQKKLGYMEEKILAYNFKACITI